jgi:hypothetical protein
LEAPEVRLTIPAVLRRIDEQMDGIMKITDFGGGGAESPYCSFHASYMRKQDGTIKALPRRQSQCCCVKSSEARDFVSQQWSGKAAGCDGLKRPHLWMNSCSRPWKIHSLFPAWCSRMPTI